jgi:uroporphyrin-III C-methyltransferase
MYMGMSGARRIQTELLTGLPASTPVAVIQNASLPTQRHISCKLGELANAIEADNMASPSVIVVGDVVACLALAAAHPQAAAA